MVTTRNCLNSSFYRQYYTSIQETDALMLTTIIGACTLSFLWTPMSGGTSDAASQTQGQELLHAKYEALRVLINVEANN